MSGGMVSRSGAKPSAGWSAPPTPLRRAGIHIGRPGVGIGAGERQYSGAYLHQRTARSARGAAVANRPADRGAEIIAAHDQCVRAEEVSPSARNRAGPPAAIAGDGRVARRAGIVEAGEPEIGVDDGGVAGRARVEKACHRGEATGVVGNDRIAGRAVLVNDSVDMGPTKKFGAFEEVLTMPAPAMVKAVEPPRVNE